MRLIGYRWMSRMVAAIIVAAATVSCLDNETPRPDVFGEILSLEVEGQIGSTVDAANRTVALRLGEAVDMRSVRVSGLTLTEGGSCNIAVGDVIDLTSPKKVMVRTVSGYEWTISATQTIEYRFEVKGWIVTKNDKGEIVSRKEAKQVGRTHFEMHTRRAFAFLPVGTDLMQIEITALKLAPEGVNPVYTPALTTLLGEPQPFRPSHIGDLTAVRKVEVEYRGVSETWELHVTENDTVIEIVDPFAYWVNVSAFGLDESGCGFEYRLAEGFDAGAEPEAQGWIRINVPGEDIDVQNGSFCATIEDLTPETEYLVRAFSGESTGDIEEFTTTGTKELPGAGFDDWHMGVDNRSSLKLPVYNPWPQEGVWEANRWWDSGNKGVAFAGYDGGNSLPRDEPGCPADPDGTAARLESVWAMIKVAGGNIYFGEFGSLIAGSKLDATCRLGHNWNTEKGPDKIIGNKPTRLKGWYKYSPQPIDRIATEHWMQHPKYKQEGFTDKDWLGTTDSLHVCVALWASPDGRDTPFVVNTDTRPNQFLDFARDQPGVIAYGAFISGKEQKEWAEFDIPIEYLIPGELPTNTQLYLLITSSKSCNYFIAGTGGSGGTGSLMYVDELKLEYDR